MFAGYKGKIMSQRLPSEMVKVSQIHLDHENPRHEQYETQDEVIAYLCKDEEVAALARDISKHGLNPLEMLAVLPGKTKTTFVAAEGNRRLCALKLLNDPDLAPPNLRKTFDNLSQKWVPITQVPAVKFQNRAAVQLWLDRIHQGPNGGIGRRDWNADQKARNSGERKNQIALTILDYAEQNGLISSDQRKKKLTTVQRFFSNPHMREALGIDLSDPDGIARNRPRTDFDKLLQIFIRDLLSDEGIVNSRMNKQAIEAYARTLARNDNISGSIVEAEVLLQPKPIIDETPTNQDSARPVRPNPPRKLNYDEEIAAKLDSLNNFKLRSLYFSICDISLSNHTPLVAVGLWSFMESLAKKMGATNDFLAFFSNDRLSKLGFGDKQKFAGLRQAIQRVSSYGNTTKHDEEAANFNGTQLANDMDVMRQLIKACIDSILAPPPN